MNSYADARPFSYRTGGCTPVTEILRYIVALLFSMMTGACSANVTGLWAGQVAIAPPRREAGWGTTLRSWRTAGSSVVLNSPGRSSTQDHIPAGRLGGGARCHAAKLQRSFQLKLRFGVPRSWCGRVWRCGVLRLTHFCVQFAPLGEDAPLLDGIRDALDRHDEGGLP